MKSATTAVCRLRHVILFKRTSAYACVYFCTHLGACNAELTIFKCKIFLNFLDILGAATIKYKTLPSPCETYLWFYYTLSKLYKSCLFKMVLMCTNMYCIFMVYALFLKRYCTGLFFHDMLFVLRVLVQNYSLLFLMLQDNGRLVVTIALL